MKREYRTRNMERVVVDYKTNEKLYMVLLELGILDKIAEKSLKLVTANLQEEFTSEIEGFYVYMPGGPVKVDFKLTFEE